SRKRSSRWRRSVCATSWSCPRSSTARASATMRSSSERSSARRRSCSCSRRGMVGPVTPSPLALAFCDAAPTARSLHRFGGPDNVRRVPRRARHCDRSGRPYRIEIGQIGIGSMEIAELSAPGYEKVLRAEEPSKGWCATIAVHDTTLGPAVGGLRMWKYATKEEALTDVLRLARGMTYKSAVARTGLGGGKAGVIGDSQKEKSDELFFWLGRFLETLKGRYVTAEDVGISALDLDLVARETRWVTGRAREVGGSGDPSPYTALGTFVSLQTCLKEVFGTPEVKGRRVAMQGLGHVGYWLPQHPPQAGGEPLVTPRPPPPLRR